MGTPYLGEIRPFAFGLTPKGWAPCMGQLLAINTNQPLFSLLGTTYGGNGVQTFGLPDLRGRVSLSTGADRSGTGYTLGQAAGEETHVLSIPEMAVHTHQLSASNAATGSQSTPSASVALGVTSGSGSSSLSLYGSGAPQAALAAGAIGANGAGQGHPNLMPFLAFNFCIAMQGIFPSRN